jgi:hypothetical protein
MLLRITAIKVEIVNEVRKKMSRKMKQREKTELHVESNMNTNKHGCQSLTLVQTHNNATISSKKQILY